MQNNRTYYGYVGLLWLLQGLAVFLCAGQPLFWDNVLLSGKIPTALYNNQLLTPFVPESLAGYSPLWGAYIAQGWLWFGRSLFVTHMLMLPWLWLLSFQLVQLVQLFVPRRALGLSIAVVHSVPVLVALSVQCGPDLAMLALYLTAQNALLHRNRALLAVCLLPLAMVSPRGLWCLVPLFVLDQLLVGRKIFPARWLWQLTKATAFLPVALLALIWYIVAYQHYGWVFNNPSGDFAALAAYTTLPEYLYQLGIFCWRLLDFGQAAIWLALVPIVVVLLRGKLEPQEHRAVLILLWLVPTVSFALFFAAFRNPIGHRYVLIPLLMGAVWLCFEWAEALRYPVFRQRALWLLAFLWTGHLWLAAYPTDMAKGWDATLLHLQATRAKRALLQDLALLPYAKTGLGAAYPDADNWDDAFLDSTRVAPITVNLKTNAAIFYSSASNSWAPAQLDSLQRTRRSVLIYSYWPASLQVFK